MTYVHRRLREQVILPAILFVPPPISREQAEQIKEQWAVANHGRKPMVLSSEIEVIPARRLKRTR